MFHNCIVERSEKEREIERESQTTKRSETKRNETKRNETKRNELDTIQRWLHTEII